MEGEDERGTWDAKVESFVVQKNRGLPCMGGPLRFSRSALLDPRPVV